VYVWVKPDRADVVAESVQFAPGNARVGVRSAPLRELGGVCVSTSISGLKLLVYEAVRY
jgi:hypothetical protein